MKYEEFKTHLLPDELLELQKIEDSEDLQKVCNFNGGDGTCDFFDYKKASRYLFGLMSFNLTPQGHDYWWRVVERLRAVEAQS
jgi:N-glycosylase/DNA lyase